MKNCLFVDNLTVLDFSFLHPSRGVVGESLIMDVELYGELDNQGMVFDFGDVKKHLKKEAESLVDHKLALPTSLENLDIAYAGGVARVDYTCSDGSIVQMISPEDAIVLLDTDAVTIESLQLILNQHLTTCVPKNVTRVKVRLRQESIQGAFYQYSHGLRKHAGNCQRIAHGHRSRLEIHADGQRSQLTEYQWAKRWRDIYIGTRSDFREEIVINGISHTRFAYDAAQGHFSLTLPSKKVYLIETDTTVEFIAEHIARMLKKQRPQNAFRVRAFEGVMKGAISEI
jgi:6-pyruvoyl-tetrahydropterin synthase